MLILAFDTSSNQGGVALLEKDKTLSSLEWEREGSHGELLTPAIETCLQNAGKSAANIDAIAIGHGPGSFTGVRVAVNAARTLGYALDKSVFVYDSSEIIAASIERVDLPLAILINAHKNLVFASTFVFKDGSWQRKLDLGAMTLDQVEQEVHENYLCLGDGFTEYYGAMSANLRARLVRDPLLKDEPSAETLGRLAYAKRAIRQPIVWKDVQALYIRASGAEEKLQEDLSKKT